MAKPKKVPADLRTVDLFTGKTKLEEVEDMAREEDEFATRAAANDSRKNDDPAVLQEECAIRWLGLDAFNAGDDVRVAVSKKGAVLMLIDTRNGVTYSTREQKLSLKQWTKLKQLVAEDA